VTDAKTDGRESGRMVWVGLLVGLSFIALTSPIPFLLTGAPVRPPGAALPIPETLKEHIVDYLLVWSIAVPSFVAFFGLYKLRREIRDAIAGGFVVGFLCILCLSVVLNIGNTPAGAGSIRQLAIGNFMTLVGTIVVFYFGSEAAIQIGESFAKRRPELTTAPSSPSSHPGGDPGPGGHTGSGR
jgi:hypothetical protein